MKAKRKPFLKMSLEDVRVEHFRRLLNEEEYWRERARLEAGPDSTRYQMCEMKVVTLVLALGVAVRGIRHELISGRLDPERSIFTANEYLEKVIQEGRPE